MRARTVLLTVIFATAALLLAACTGGWRRGATGTATSNGERIYFTATNDQGEPITYTGGPAFGGMGMMNAQLTCAACHGADGRGGVHTMHMQRMDAPDIRWSTLTAEEAHQAEGEEEHGEAHTGYDLDTFRRAVVEGKHPDGESLSRNMPRWNLGDDDLTDLAAFLQSLP